MYNVILIMADQMKATASHLWGNPDCTTPSLEALVHDGPPGRSVRFENCFTPHPLCVPARVSLWTSQYTHTHGCRRNETYMPAHVDHAFKIWKQHGYTTALIGKNHCFWEQEDRDLFDVWCEITHTGFDQTFPNRGMEWFRPLSAINKAHAVRRDMPDINPVFSYAFTDYPLDDYSTGLITGQTERFIADNTDNPFALWVSYPDPHAPYEVPRKYASLFDPAAITLPQWREGEMLSAPERNQVLHEILGVEGGAEEELRTMLVAYYAMVRFIDDGVGRIMQALEDNGILDNTIIVFCADHGDFAGEHGMVAKGGVFYDCLTHIPLIVRTPGTNSEGKNRAEEEIVEQSMVNLIDIVPTLFTLQDIEIPRSMQGSPLPGITLAKGREYCFSEYGAGGPAFTWEYLQRFPSSHGREVLMQSLQWRESEGRRKMVRSRSWKYVHDPTGDSDELYDLSSDPGELSNVAHVPRHKEVIEKMKTRLLEWMITTEGGAQPTPLPDQEHYTIPGSDERS